MIGWLHPIALVGLVAMAGPLVVHLLRRQRAPRLSFPSLRFVDRAATSSVRFRMPSDVGLLLLRVAIVGLAAVALAQAFAITADRRRAANERITRAIVVDAGVRNTRQTTGAVAAVSQGVSDAVRVTGSTLKDGLRDAVDALSAVPPSRQEIVVISDFRHGELTALDVGDVPARIGLRFVNVETPSDSAEFGGDTSIGAPGVPSRIQEIRATARGTEVRLRGGVDRLEGLRLETSPAVAERLRRSVARTGAPAPDPGEPIALTFHPNPGTGGYSSTTLAPWMLRTVLRMRRDRLLTEAARAHVRKASIAELPGFVVARDAEDAPVVSAVQRGSELLLILATAPEEYLSAATLQSVLIARRGEPRWDVHEVARIPSSTLVAWTRAPAFLDGRALRPPPPGDARVVWAVVLGLLVLETFVRKRREQVRQSRYADAA
ncbi:MAG: BatA domain-containing protein [Vicinamibacterales bacterium]